MKPIRAVILFAVVFFLSSCFSNQEEIWLEHDGSGRQEIKFDFSNYYSLLKMGIDKKIKENQKDSLNLEPGNQNVLETFMSKKEIDTVFVVRRIVMEALEKQGKTIDELKGMMTEKLNEGEVITKSEEELVDKLIQRILNLKIHIKVSEKNSTVQFTLIKKFQSFHELSTESNDFIDVFSLLSKFKTDTNEKLEKFNIGEEKINELKELYSGEPKYVLDGRYLRIRKKGMNFDKISESKEEMKSTLPMLKMFLGNQVHRLIIHFPGKLKKIQGNDVKKMDKNTIIIETPMIDLFDAEKEVDVKVKFKRKRRYK